jgi:2-dehydropantoate 2-reductase
MKIVIVGTGAVGGYFGARLLKAGNDVCFIARGKSLAAIKQKGISIKSIDGDFTIYPVIVTDDYDKVGKADLIIIAVKAWQVKQVALQIKHLLNDETIILPLQNGILVVEELASMLPSRNIIGGLCRIISKVESPGIINHLGVEPTIVFGEMDHKISERLLRLQTIFTEASIKSKLSENIKSELWKKFIAICVSGLLAVTRTTYGELRELKETRQLMIELLDEIYQLSKLEGINIEPGFLPKTIAFIDSFPYDSTSSLTRDVWDGKPSEIEYQNGTVVRLAQKYGLPVPVNHFVYSCILPMENKARAAISTNQK